MARVVPKPSGKGRQAAPPAPPPKAPSRPAAPPPKNAKESRELATTTNGKAGLPTDLSAMMDEDAGDGLSTDQADNLVPLIYVLQPLSPQVLRNNEAQIEGAEAGHIWLRNSGEDQLQAEIEFQPVFFWKDWPEWIPRTRGGGFAGRHPDKPAEAVQYSDPENPQAVKWKLPNGNDVVETRYYAGQVHLEDGRKLPYILPLSSTGHSVGKDMMFQMNNRRTNSGNKPALYANKVRLGTRMRSNNKGEWYVLEVLGIDWVDAESYAEGKALAASFKSGEKQADDRQMGDMNTAGGDMRDNDGSM
jgi:hypothetical protein